MSIEPDFIVSRRTTLRWLAASIASSTMLTGCGSAEEEAAAQALADLGIPAMPDGVAYGTDPDLLNPLVPWTRTMTKQQLELAATLSDVILPAGESTPAPSAVGAQDFIDEWVSAPYERQQSDREEILDGLTWLEQESLDRFSVGFAGAEAAQRLQILDDIAFKDRVKPGLEKAAGFFSRKRNTIGAIMNNPLISA